MAGDTPALLAVFAHPDDETFRCGGTLALLARQGFEVQVLTATRGGAGSCGDPPLCRPEELPAVREQELRCACDALGIAPPHLLDYADGRLSEAQPQQLIAHVLEAVCQLRPDVILSFGPDGLSGHPDHIAIGRCAAEAFHRTGEIAALYTLALPHNIAEQFGLQGMRPVSDKEITLAVDITPVWEIKLAAIHCHATQMGATPVMQAPDERRRAFFGTEYFVRAAIRFPERDILWRTLHA
jgi:LmbE family N-acetylglucosaminyl deacetylase